MSTRKKDKKTISRKKHRSSTKEPVQIGIRLFQQQVLDFLRKYWAHLLFAAIMLAGIVIRLVNIEARDIHFDESWVAYSVRQDTFKGMLETIEITPLLFNTMVFGVSRFWTSGELPLRIVPFIFGVGSLALVFLLAKKLSKSYLVAFVSLILLAFNMVHINFSKDLKQYTSDAFFTLLVLLAAEYIYTSVKSLRVRDVFIGAAGIVISILFSYSSAFSVAVVFPLLAYKFRKDRDSLIKLVVDYAIAFGFIGLYYVFFLRYHAQQGGLVGWWASRDAFPPIDSFGNLLQWLGESMNDFLVKYPFKEDMKFIWLLLPLPLISKHSSSQKRIYYYYLGILLLMLFASFLHKYVFMASRVTMFTVPLVIVIVSMGIREVLRNIKVNVINVVIVVSVFSFLFYPYFAEMVRRESITYDDAWSEGRAFVESHLDDGTYIMNFNMAGTLWWYHMEEICNDRECDDLHGRTVDELLEDIAERGDGEYIVVMRSPFSGRAKRQFWRHRDNFKRKVEKIGELTDSFEETYTYIYEVSVPEEVPEVE